jgi:high-affinity nickel permease
MATHSAELSFAARVSQFRDGLTRTEWVRLGGMASVIIGLNVLGWVTIAAFVAPHHYSLGTKTFGLGVGVGVTAYTLGMRHAFDGDHIGFDTATEIALPRPRGESRAVTTKATCSADLRTRRLSTEWS